MEFLEHNLIYNKQSSKILFQVYFFPILFTFGLFRNKIFPFSLFKNMVYKISIWKEVCLLQAFQSFPNKYVQRNIYNSLKYEVFYKECNFAIFVFSKITENKKMWHFKFNVSFVKDNLYHFHNIHCCQKKSIAKSLHCEHYGYERFTSISPQSAIGSIMLFFLDVNDMWHVKL